MKRSLILAGLTVCLLAGCSSSPMASGPQQPLALTQFSAQAQPEYSGTGVVHLGAGDELGREIYTNYLAYLRTDDGEYYATGEEDE